MLNEILNLAINNGLWAVLFVLLFLYQIKTCIKREEKYQEVIDKLAVSFGIIKNMDKKINNIASNVNLMVRCYKC